MFLSPLASQRGDVWYAWRGPSMLIVDHAGWAGAHPLTGYFFRQARYLKYLRLLLGGRAPHPCSIAEDSPNELELTFIHPEVEHGGGGGSGSGGIGDGGGLLVRDLDLRMRYVVRPASLEVTVVVTNRWQAEVELEAAWQLSADYASVDEAQFGVRSQEAAVDSRPLPNGVAFRYLHPDLTFETRVTATGGAEWRFGADGLAARLRLPRQQPVALTLRVEAFDPVDPISREGEEARERKLAAWQEGLTELHAPGETPLVEIANRAARDVGSFALLEGAADEWLTPGAGAPLYLSLWGRDALTGPWQAGLLDRGAMLEDVLVRLGRMQGVRVDPERDEEPGRIIGQAKTDPVTRASKNPFDRYYADVASPFMFIIGLGYHFALTGDTTHARRHWDAALRVLDWADRYGAADGGGYIRYLTRSPIGPTHQGWKDSENAIVDEDGHKVPPPIAASEIQGYWHVALQFMAGLAVALGEPERAADLWRRAAELKERFNRDFWMDDLDCVALGLDEAERPIRSITSNAGQCLPTGILTPEHATRLVRRLFEPDMFSGWGIRTLSSHNPAYNPLDYHLGSVWPVENATILFGLRRYGFNERALELTRGLYDLARMWPGGRTPECVGGYHRDDLSHPGAFPRANRPQMWNQSVWPVVTQSLVGVVPWAPAHLLLVDPILPSWLPELSIKRLRVGDATVSLRFHRDSQGESHYQVLERHSKLRVVRQPWFESFSAGRWDRLHDLAESAAVSLTGRI